MECDDPSRRPLPFYFISDREGLPNVYRISLDRTRYRPVQYVLRAALPYRFLTRSKPSSR